MPAVFALVVLRFLPAVIGATYAFTSWNGVGMAADWSGFENFRAIFDEPITSKALFNTFRLTGLLVVIANVGGLLLALCLHRALKTRNLLRALFFVPFALSHLASGYIWQYVFQYNGPLNRLLGRWGWSRGSAPGSPIRRARSRRSWSSSSGSSSVFRW